jgi:hypothetical protein
MREADWVTTGHEAHASTIYRKPAMLMATASAMVMAQHNGDGTASRGAIKEGMT